jgi:hypothetical protein
MYSGIYFGRIQKDQFIPKMLMLEVAAELVERLQIRMQLIELCGQTTQKFTYLIAVLPNC